MAVRKIKNSWWVDFWFNYVRYRKRSPENSRAGALAYEVVLRRKLAHGEDIDNTTRMTTQEQLFERFAWKWFDEYVLSNNKPSEQQTKKYILSASLVPFFGKMPVKQITTNDIEKYKAHALKEGVTRKTVNNRLTVFRKCLSTAYEWLDLEGRMPKIKWLKCPPPTTDYLSPDECALLLSKVDGIVREIILTALRTGMRQGELKGLQWSSIDWQNKVITVRHSWCEYTKGLCSPKSNRERYIPIDNDVYEVLLRRKKNTGYVFLDADDKVFNDQRLERRLMSACKKAGLRKIGWHTLRHTFASHLAMKGVPINTVQTLLGHTDIRTTMRYAHVAPSTLRTAIDLLNPKCVLSVDFGQPVGNQWLQVQRREVAQKIRVPENRVLTS